MTNPTILKVDGKPAFAVIPWDEYCALVGREPAAEQEQAVNEPTPKPQRRSIEQLREEKGLSGPDLARLCGVSPSYFAMMERGERGISASHRRAIAQGLGVDEADIEFE